MFLTYPTCVGCGPDPGADHSLGKCLSDGTADVKRKQTRVAEEAFLTKEDRGAPETTDKKASIPNYMTIPKFCMAKETIN